MFDAITIDENNFETTHNRTKRSFYSSWLSSMTGLAEQQEINEVKQFENQLLQREKTLGETLGVLTARGNVVTKELQDISKSITENLQTESDIYNKITEVINNQILGDKEVNKLIGILDQNIKKANRITSILSELLLLEKTVDKFQKYVNNAVTNQMDIFDTDARALVQHFGSHGLESLKFTDSEVVWGEEGFEIQYHLRRLSEGYKIFNFKSMSISTDASNTLLGTKLNIERSLAVSSTGEYVLGSDFSTKCTRKGTTVFCNPNDVLIHRNGSDRCEMVILNNWLIQEESKYTQCYDDVIITETMTQDYILKEDSLLIMSREADKGRYSCTGGDRDNAKQVIINKGLTRFKGFNKCGLQTTFLSIPGGYDGHVTAARLDIDDLDMDKAMMELDKHMSDKLKRPFNITALMEKLNYTEDKLILEHKNLENLHDSLTTLNNIKELPKFTFTDINPLGEVSHKTITAIVSSTVIIIVIVLITMCCCTICSGNMSLCCAPLKCLCACLGCCTDAIEFGRGKINTKNKNDSLPHEVESILNTTEMTFLDDSSAKYTPTAPIIKPTEWRILRIDDDFYLVAEKGNKLYKYDVKSKTVFLGNERHDEIENPGENRIRDLIQMQNNRRLRKTQLYGDLKMDD